jgi:hypothetical protein
MATQTFSKFIRPEAGRNGPITDRDLDILDAVLRYRFCSAAQIVRLTGGNEDVTHRRLRWLWERDHNVTAESSEAHFGRADRLFANREEDAPAYFQRTVLVSPIRRGRPPRRILHRAPSGSPFSGSVIPH